MGTAYTNPDTCRDNQLKDSHLITSLLLNVDGNLKLEKDLSLDKLLNYFGGILRLLISRKSDNINNDGISEIKLIDLYLVDYSKEVKKVCIRNYEQFFLTRSRNILECPIFCLSIYLIIYFYQVQKSDIRIDSNNFDEILLYPKLDEFVDGKDPEMEDAKNIDIEALVSGYHRESLVNGVIELSSGHTAEVSKIISKELAGLSFPWLPKIKQKLLILSSLMKPKDSKWGSKYTNLCDSINFLEYIGITFIDCMAILSNSRNNVLPNITEFLKTLVPNLLENQIFIRIKSNKLYNSVQYKNIEDKAHREENIEVKNDEEKKLRNEYQLLETQFQAFEKHFGVLNNELLFEVDSLQQNLNDTKDKCDEILSSQKSLIEIMKKAGEEDNVNIENSSLGNTRGSTSTAYSPGSRRNTLYALLEGIEINNRNSQNRFILDANKIDKPNIQGTQMLPSLSHQLSLTPGLPPNQLTLVTDTENTMSVARALTGFKSNSTKNTPSAPPITEVQSPTGTSFGTIQRLPLSHISDQQFLYSPSPRTYDSNTPDIYGLLSLSDVDYRSQVNAISNQAGGARSSISLDNSTSRINDSRQLKLPPIKQPNDSYSPYFGNAYPSNKNISNTRGPLFIGPKTNLNESNETINDKFSKNEKFIPI